MYNKGMQVVVTVTLKLETDVDVGFDGLTAAEKMQLAQEARVHGAIVDLAIISKEFEDEQ